MNAVVSNRIVADPHEMTQKLSECAGGDSRPHSTYRPGPSERVFVVLTSPVDLVVRGREIREIGIGAAEV
jgi:hypothetical protein